MKQFIFALFALVILASCSDDDDTSTSQVAAEDVEANMPGPDWRIVQYRRDGQNMTASYENYDLHFGADHGVLAVSDTETFDGAWAVTENVGAVYLNLVFTDPDTPFASVSDDWQVMENTPDIVRLQHAGDNGVDLLTLERAISSAVTDQKVIFATTLGVRSNE
jgi:hypothetical protein